MDRAIDSIIEFIQFAGVAVALVGVVVAVVRAAMASLSAGRAKRVSAIGLDLARTVLVGIDLMLVAAILEVAIAADEVSFTRLATVAGLRIGLTVLISFEDAYRADTAGERMTGTRPWGKALGRAREPRATPPVVAERSGDNVWADRARLGRDWHSRRSVG